MHEYKLNKANEVYDYYKTNFIDPKGNLERKLLKTIQNGEDKRLINFGKKRWIL